MNEKIILHCDLNNFYASVECELNPELKDVALAVSGNPEKRHGVVLAKNEIESTRPDAIAKFMSKMKTEIKLMTGNADRKIAELMTDGCDMGIKSLTQYLNEYAAADENARDLTGKLIKIEENTREKLKAYL